MAKAKAPAQSSTPAVAITPQDRFYTLAADLLEIVLAALKSDTAAILSRRLGLLVRGVIIPDGIQGCSHTIGAALNINEQSADTQARKNGIPATRPGSRSVYRLSDVTISRKRKPTRKGARS